MSLAKTEINCSFKAFAFQRSVDAGVLEVVDSVGMPVPSFLKLFMYDQNVLVVVFRACTNYINYILIQSRDSLSARSISLVFLHINR